MTVDPSLTVKFSVKRSPLITAFLGFALPLMLLACGGLFLFSVFRINAILGLIAAYFAFRYAKGIWSDLVAIRNHDAVTAEIFSGEYEGKRPIVQVGLLPRRKYWQVCTVRDGIEMYRTYPAARVEDLLEPYLNPLTITLAAVELQERLEEASHPRLLGGYRLRRRLAEAGASAA